MNYNEPQQHALRRDRRIVAMIVAFAMITLLSALGWVTVTALASTAPAGQPLGQAAPGSGRSDGLGESGPERGIAPDRGTGQVTQSAFDDGDPAVANLKPDLLAALRKAESDAARDGVSFRLNSGWRSAEEQERLRRDAVNEYGSEREAARWVATPRGSAHVSGDAVDIGDMDATAWLSENGQRYGLCQIYDNEPWHFELRDVANGCPARFTDPSEDPRTTQ